MRFEYVITGLLGVSWIFIFVKKYFSQRKLSSAPASAPAQQPQSTNPPRWQFWRGWRLTNGHMRGAWVRSRVRIRESALNLFTISIIVWCVWELFPGTRHLYAGRQGFILGTLLVLIGLLGVGWFRGAYGQVMCPKNYLFPVLFVLAIILLVLYILPRIQGGT